MKYRKRPVVIEAFQMTKERRWDNSEWPEWLNRAWNSRGEGALWPSPDHPRVQGRESAQELAVGTPEGVAIVVPDDWIIQGVKGELYPCRPDIFEATYDVEPSEQPVTNV